MNSAQSRIQIEDTLKHFHECEYEGHGRPATTESVAGVLGCTRDHAAQLLDSLQESAWVSRSGLEFRLTQEGRDAARQIIRTHRLIETQLATQSAIPSTRWHREADRREHRIAPEEVEKLDRNLGHPRFDPHGDPIPTSTGLLPPHRGTALSSCQADGVVEVVHVGDEPEVIGRSLAKKGLAPGQLLRIRSTGEKGVHAELDGKPLFFTPGEASELQVRTTAREEMEDQLPLSELDEGRSGVVAGLSPACRGSQRTRLLDLGFVRGSQVSVEMHSPLGRPTAYRVRGTLIALRPSQARWVLLSRESVA